MRTPHPRRWSRPPSCPHATAALGAQKAAVDTTSRKLAIASNKLLQQMRVALAGVPAELIRVLGTPPLSDQISTLGVKPLRSLNSTTLNPYTDAQISKALDIVQRTGGIRGASTQPLVPLK